jgi:CHAT domain-containing protein/tetratricopeptide (TPR) repeat protein
MKKIILVVIVLSFSLQCLLLGQNREAYDLILKYNELNRSGDFIKADETLLSVLNMKNVSREYLLAVYNNLGVVDLTLGNYDKALEYNYRAESFTGKDDHNGQNVADIFNNRGYIFYIKKSFDVAIDYLEKSIRIYQNLNNQNQNVLSHLSSAYINISISYLETKKYLLALHYLKKNVDLNVKHKLNGLPLTYLNIAKTYARLRNSKKAEEYYLKSISSFKKEYGDRYYRMADAYFDYGLFLQSQDKNSYALEAYRKALFICRINYGEKHTFLSLAYKHMGDNYFIQNKYDSALYYYQKSLIAVVKNFNNPDIYSNPSIDSSLFDIRLLDNLKCKSQALELFAVQQKDSAVKLKRLNSSLATIDLALQLIDRIRNNYMSEESRIYLAENEKETYLFAAHLAYSLYLLNHDPGMGKKMYSIAQKAKAAILRNEITGNELLYSSGVPDSLREKQNTLSTEIAAYNNLILDESRKTLPDSAKIALWKDALFDMNREKEKVAAKIETVFPEFHDLIRKTEPDSLKQIQGQLKNDEIIVDYLLSNQYTGGKRKLYVFIISGKNLNFSELWLDSLFIKNADILRKTSNPTLTGGSNVTYIAYTDALHYMYLNLIKPVEEQFTGKRLIIIPDEEIGWLPFDAFIKNKPAPGQTDYEGLHYLINDYTFSYGYSSSLIFNKSRKSNSRSKVFAFSPDYDNLKTSGAASLPRTGLEIGSIYKGFRGKKFTGTDATKANFLTSLKNPVILHLAMHSMSDSINSKYSYLLFDTHNVPEKEGKLYNYEISLTRIISPMVVLSACNSGTGTLYFGEGLMSLARSFTLAGASSVIKTAWDINDEASAAVMTDYYNFLSKGKAKNDAMRLAKLEYLKKSPPEFTHPYFWAAYEVMGDNSPVARNSHKYIIVISLVVIFTGLILFFYFNRRKIFSERSR